MARAEMTWEAAIEKVLSTARGPLHYSAISDRIIAEKLRTSLGATPAQTVMARLSQSLAKPDTPFIKVAPGQYALRAVLDAVQVGVQHEVTESPEGEAEETGALQAFGMYWRRDLVVWTGKGRLWGVQGSGASRVNFAEQVGVYLLHDRDRVIYVGRAGDTLFARLRAHTNDRLGGRWDRFSWFGLKSVSQDGSLGEASVAWASSMVIDTMEALLIESLEPPLNRKRGDNFSAAEYLQMADPELAKAEKLKIINELAANIQS